MSILNVVLDDLGSDPRTTREDMKKWADTQTIHEFEDGVVFEKNNELHVHFFSKNWIRVKNKLTPIMKKLFETYDTVYIVSDIPNAQKALELFGATRDGMTISITKERFENVWCK